MAFFFIALCFSAAICSGQTITTFAGTTVNTYAGDGGAATSALLFQPTGVAVCQRVIKRSVSLIAD